MASRPLKAETGPQTTISTLSKFCLPFGALGSLIIFPKSASGTFPFMLHVSKSDFNSELPRPTSYGNSLLYLPTGKEEYTTRWFRRCETRTLFAKGAGGVLSGSVE